MSQFVAYILQFQEIIVYKIPPGGGVYSQPKVYYVYSFLRIPKWSAAGKKLVGQFDVYWFMQTG